MRSVKSEKGESMTFTKIFLISLLLQFTAFIIKHFINDLKFPIECIDQESMK